MKYFSLLLVLIGYISFVILLLINPDTFYVLSSLLATFLGIWIYKNVENHLKSNTIIALFQYLGLMLILTSLVIVYFVANADDNLNVKNTVRDWGGVFQLVYLLSPMTLGIYIFKYMGTQKISVFILIFTWVLGLFTLILLFLTVFLLFMIFACIFSGEYVFPLNKGIFSILILLFSILYNLKFIGELNNSDDSNSKQGLMQVIFKIIKKLI
jgi:hypothetical protein